MNEDSSKNGWTSQYGNVTMDIASIIFLNNPSLAESQVSVYI